MSKPNSSRRLHALALALILLAAVGPLSAATDDRASAAVQTVRLKRLAVGCHRYEDLKRTIDVAVTSTRERWLATVEEAGCTIYETVHGPVTTRSPDGLGVCVLGLTMQECVWFGAFDVEPARPL